MSAKLLNYIATPVGWLTDKFGSASLSLDPETAKSAAVVVDKDGNVQVNMTSEAFQQAFRKSLIELRRVRTENVSKGEGA